MPGTPLCPVRSLAQCPELQLNVSVLCTFFFPSKAAVSLEGGPGPLLFVLSSMPGISQELRKCVLFCVYSKLEL